MAMTIAQSMLAEFETQAPITQRFLERLPEDKLTWKPHEKSMSAGQLAYHLAFIPGGAIRFVQNKDRKSTRLNSSHGYISYAVFCLKKKKHKARRPRRQSALARSVS